MGIGLLGGSIYILDPIINIICQSLLQLVLCDIVLLIHILKDDPAPFGIIFSAGNGIKTGGVFGDGGENRTFRERQIGDFFIEIPPCGHLNAQGIVAQVDGVEIVGDDDFFCFFLAHAGILFQLYGQILLLKLSFNARSPACLHTAGENIVFDQLLCNGASAAGIIVADETVNGSGDGSQVYAVVGPETGVLNSHKGVDQILGKLLIGGGLAVGAAGDQGIGQIAVRVIDSGCKTVRLNVHDVHRGGIVNDSFNHTETYGCTCYSQKQKQHKKSLKDVKEQL